RLSNRDRQAEMADNRRQPRRQVPAPRQAARDGGVIDSPTLLLRGGGAAGKRGVSAAILHLLRHERGDGEPTRGGQQSADRGEIGVAVIDMPRQGGREGRLALHCGIYGQQGGIVPVDEAGRRQERQRGLQRVRVSQRGRERRAAGFGG